jgi:hypothetical protein
MPGERAVGVLGLRGAVGGALGLELLHELLALGGVEVVVDVVDRAGDHALGVGDHGDERGLLGLRLPGGEPPGLDACHEGRGHLAHGLAVRGEVGGEVLLDLGHRLALPGPQIHRLDPLEDVAAGGVIVDAHRGRLRCLLGGDGCGLRVHGLGAGTCGGPHGGAGEQGDDRETGEDLSEASLHGEHLWPPD